VDAMDWCPFKNLHSPVSTFLSRHCCPSSLHAAPMAPFNVPATTPRRMNIYIYAKNFKIKKYFCFFFGRTRTVMYIHVGRTYSTYMYIHTYMHYMNVTRMRCVVCVHLFTFAVFPVSFFTVVNVLVLFFSVQCSFLAAARLIILIEFVTSVHFDSFPTFSCSFPPNCFWNHFRRLDQNVDAADLFENYSPVLDSNCCRCPNQWEAC